MKNAFQVLTLLQTSTDQSFQKCSSSTFRSIFEGKERTRQANQRDYNVQERETIEIVEGNT